MRQGQFVPVMVLTMVTMILSEAPVLASPPAHAQAALHAKCPQCEVLSSREIHMPFSGVGAFRLVAKHKNKDDIVQILVDDQGVETTAKELREREARARFQAIGRKSPALAEYMETQDAVTDIPVYIVAPIDIPDADRARIASGDEAYAQEAMAAYQEAVQEGHEGLMDLLDEMGLSPDGIPPDVPAVRVMATRDQIDQLAWGDEPVMLFRDEGPGIPTSARWIYASEVDQPHDWAYTGDGRKLAVILEENPPSSVYDGGSDDTIELEDIYDPLA